MPDWCPSIGDIMHYASAGGGWATLDSLEYEVAFSLTNLTFIFGQVRSPGIGTYEREPTKVCDLYG